MTKENLLIDLHAHSHLKGKVYKRRVMDPMRLRGIAFFGLSGFLYSSFPYCAAHLGSAFTTLAMTGSSLAGMIHLAEQKSINSIEFLREGEHAGKFKFNVSETLFKSKDLIVGANQA